MRFSVALPLAGAAGLAQVAFLNQVRVFGVAPDLFLAITIIAAVSSDIPHALLIGIATGMFKDIFDSGPFGVNTAVFPFAAMLVAWLNRTLSLENGFSCAVITLAVVIAADICSWVILSYAQATVPSSFARVVFLEALLTAVTVPPLFGIAAAAARSLR
jgi:rod shape-determining protein MreD